MEIATAPLMSACKRVAILKDLHHVELEATFEELLTSCTDGYNIARVRIPFFADEPGKVVVDLPIDEKKTFVSLMLGELEEPGLQIRLPEKSGKEFVCETGLLSAMINRVICAVADPGAADKRLNIKCVSLAYMTGSLVVSGTDTSRAHTVGPVNVTFSSEKVTVLFPFAAAVAWRQIVGTKPTGHVKVVFNESTREVWLESQTPEGTLEFYSRPPDAFPLFEDVIPAVWDYTLQVATGDIKNVVTALPTLSKTEPEWLYLHGTRDGDCDLEGMPETCVLHFDLKKSKTAFGAGIPANGTPPPFEIAFNAKFFQQMIQAAAIEGRANLTISLNACDSPILVKSGVFTGLLAPRNPKAKG